MAAQKEPTSITKAGNPSDKIPEAGRSTRREVTKLCWRDLLCWCACSAGLQAVSSLPQPLTSNVQEHAVKSCGLELHVCDTSHGKPELSTSQRCTSGGA